MALRDYILCKRCECKLIFDGYDEHRDTLEARYGDPDAPTFTPLLLCPDCIHALEDQNKGLLEALGYAADDSLTVGAARAAIAKAKGEE